jgi:DNA-3-methyladenine glycosylase II
MAAAYDTVAAVSHLTSADPRLATLIRHVGPCRLEVGRMESPFRSLLRAIVYQQLSGRAAATIYGRLEVLFPDRQPDPVRLLDLTEDQLRSAGLSRAKTAAAIDLATRTLDGTVPPRSDLDALEDPAIVERLTAVRGVGIWTVQMLLIFELGRPDVLPSTDLGVRRGFARLMGLEALPPPSVVETYAARWRPYRSVASWYLWRGSEVADLPD